MAEIISMIVGSFITCYICTILLTSKFLNRNEYFKLKNFIIIIIAIPILRITSNFYMAYKIISVMIIYTIIIKLIYKRSIIFSFIICIFSYLIVLASDVINALIYLIIFKIDINYINQRLYMIYIMHFSFLGVAIVISLFIKQKNFFNEIEDFILKKNLTSVIEYLIFFTVFTGILGYIISKQPFISSQHISSIALLILFIIMNATYFNQIKISTKSKYDYDNIYNYTSEMEKLTKQLTSQEHEHKNRLMGIQALIESSNYGEAIEFIKGIMGEQKENRSLFSANYDKVDNVVLKKLLIEKTNKALDAGIKINAEVRNEIKNIHISNIELNDIISIVIDNAIDAAEKSKEKTIDIMIESDFEEVSIIVANTYSKTVEEVALYQDGASSKGKFRGNGLYILKQIENNNPNINIDTVITEEVFIQEVNIMNAKEAK